MILEGKDQNMKVKIIIIINNVYVKHNKFYAYGMINPIICFSWREKISARGSE